MVEYGLDFQLWFILRSISGMRYCLSHGFMNADRLLVPQYWMRTFKTPKP